MESNQLVATKGSPPVAFAARSQAGRCRAARSSACVRVARRILWRHERRSNVLSLSTRGSRQVELAILQAVAGHRQVLPTHHTARKIISESKKSHSRSGLVKELTHRIACRGGDIPTVVDGRRSRAAMKAPKRRLCRSFDVAHRSEL